MTAVESPSALLRHAADRLEKLIAAVEAMSSAERDLLDVVAKEFFTTPIARAHVIWFRLVASSPVQLREAGRDGAVQEALDAARIVLGAAPRKREA